MNILEKLKKMDNNKKILIQSMIGLILGVISIILSINNNINLNLHQHQYKTPIDSNYTNIKKLEEVIRNLQPGDTLTMLKSVDTVLIKNLEVKYYHSKK